MNVGTEHNYQIMATEGYFSTGSASITVSEGTPNLATTSTTAPTTTNTGTVALYGQCGGTGWTGPTVCAQGTCTKQDAYYWQCK